ncbi:P-loop containing nucleoside triphosphate hydrolase protein [Lactarius pseudohatsudake]|nr:P-loop containing nucleoside triphosphate hydrolase protein [Lactarius pseudohatsudake]
MTLTARRVRASVTSFHLSSLLLGTFSVYAYRNIWPLLTFTLSPVDAWEGALLWVRIGLLAFAAIVIPLLVINPEQTASLLCMMLYTFLDPIVFLAYRVPHLSHDMLPPLADYDYTRNLHLDTFSGGPRRHIFWGFMKVFRREYIQLAIFVVIKVTSNLMAPVGMNQLLRYLETRGEGAVVRPWVWVAYIFLGPALGTIAFQCYNFIATGTLVRVTAIVTQLVFEHALRIRLKAETSRSPESTPTATPEVGSEDTTPDSGSVVEINIVSEEAGGSGEETRSEQSTIAASSSKGERKEEASGSDSDEAGGSSNLVGKMNNLVSTDLENLVDGRDFLLLILYIPLQMVICVWFLCSILGWSAFAGMAVMVALFPIPGTVAGKIQKIQRETMKRTDARVQAATETMGILSMIKLFGWEPKIAARLAEKREQELRYIKLRQILIVINGNIKGSSFPVFDLIRDQLQLIFWMIPLFIRARVSLDRVNDFLHDTELLDEFADAKKGSERVMPTDASHFDQDVIGFRNASFTWSNDHADGTLTPSRRFTLRVQGELLFKRGCFNLIIGPTGSGKTSLLMALLGEMHFVPMSPDSWYHLPREGGVSYAAQESWVQNETIRDNILFGAAYDEERYNKVIYQCGLQRDLSLFDAGDKTEVGEKGLTLSGGQKARVTLARAVYSSSQILILDDVLAALDVHTARWIVEKCFKGDLIRGRTILLVTHNVAMATPLTDLVVLLGKDGRIASRGSVSDALKKDKMLAKELAESTRAIEDNEKNINSEKPEETAKLADGKLILAEEISEGNVSWDAVKLFINGLGGAHPVLFWVVFAGGMLLFSTLMTVQAWFMGYWAEQYNIYPPDQVNITFYVTVYGLILLVATAGYTMGFCVYMFGALRASRTIHRTLIESVLGTTLRCISKCRMHILHDPLALVDSPLADAFFWVIDISGAMLIKFVAVVYFTPAFSVPGISIAVLGAWLGRIYMKAQIAIKREMSNAKAPVLGHFGASVAGLTSIRAYGAQIAFREESYRRIDRYSRAHRSFWNMNRWINLRTDFLGGLFAASLAAYLIYLPTERSLPSDTGFSLTMAIGFSGLILWWVRNLNNFEVLIGATYSLERMHSYINAEQEPKPTEQGIPPAYWPASGDLRVEKLSARYSHDGPKVLHDISFHVKSGERVGVVGRTGSGKSSLTLSLLRCIFTEGSVYYDGHLTSSINLDALRSNITIIPQIPELLSGSLRENLDPFSQYDDAALNSALHASGLFSLQTDDEDDHLTLDSQIASGGSNLSVGQRQILALARAIVRGSKLLILDEDYKTDTIIQTSLRTELKGDITLITVAHRLQTIIDADKVMVLDAGRIVEFDKPSELLKLEDGRFRSLVDESGDRELLYSIASSAGKAQH